MRRGDPALLVPSYSSFATAAGRVEMPDRVTRVRVIDERRLFDLVTRGTVWRKPGADHPFRRRIAAWQGGGKP